MSHFSNEKTDVELFIIDNFNFEDDNPYTSQIEEEGEFVDIKQISTEEEVKNGNRILNDSEPPIK